MSPGNVVLGRAIALWVASMGLTQSSLAAPMVYTRVPTSTIEPNLEIRDGTSIQGINDRGQFVGTFGERNWVIWGMPHGFIYGSTGYGTGPGTPDGSYGRWGGYRLGRIEGERYPDPDYRYLDLMPAPESDFNSRVSVPFAISRFGMVVGKLTADEYGSEPSVAFKYNSLNGKMTLINIPGAISSEALDINASGQIVGNFRDATGDHGFLLHNDSLQIIDRPGAAGYTRVFGINDAGTIVGRLNDVSVPFSFIYRSGVFEDFMVPGEYTSARDINNAEQIVGSIGVTGKRRGFLYQNGKSVILDYAENDSTYANSINNRGEIAGTTCRNVSFTCKAPAPLQPNAPLRVCTPVACPPPASE